MTQDNQKGWNPTEIPLGEEEYKHQQVKEAPTEVQLYEHQKNQISSYLGAMRDEGLVSDEAFKQALSHLEEKDKAIAISYSKIDGVEYFFGESQYDTPFNVHGGIPGHAPAAEVGLDTTSNAYIVGPEPNPEDNLNVHGGEGPTYFELTETPDELRIRNPHRDNDPRRDQDGDVIRSLLGDHYGIDESFEPRLVVLDQPEYEAVGGVSLTEGSITSGVSSR